MLFARSYNHELDSGPGEFYDSIDKDNLKACFPHLAANINFSGESPELKIGTDGDEAIEMKGKVAQYAVVTVHGEKIGVVVVKVTGIELKGLLEHGVSESGSGKTPGQFPQVGGFRYKYDLGNSVNKRITEIVYR